jgi:hypothetical protein
MAKSKANRSRAGNKPSQRVHKYPLAKGKVIAEVELSLSPDYNVIEVVLPAKHRSRLAWNHASKFPLSM